MPDGKRAFLASSNPSRSTVPPNQRPSGNRREGAPIPGGRRCPTGGSDATPRGAGPGAPSMEETMPRWVSADELLRPTRKREEDESLKHEQAQQVAEPGAAWYTREQGLSWRWHPPPARLSRNDD
jgi:hypothetical protein